MVKFWKMLIAMLAMMAMVVVPTSCGDDDDDDNGSNSSSKSLKGKVFVDEYEEDGYYAIEIYSFDEETVTRYLSEVCDYRPDENGTSNRTYRYEVLSNGQISFHDYFYRYKDGKLYYIDDEDGEEGEEGIEDKTGRSAEQILKEWKEKHPIKEQVEEPGKPEIQVVEGGVYTAKNEALGLAFTFRVTKVSGYYAYKVVDLEVEYQGQKYQIELSDQGPSNLMWTETNGFEAVFMSVAKYNANKIVMVLSFDDADYRIISPTIHLALKEMGATKTVFSKAK